MRPGLGNDLNLGEIAGTKQPLRMTREQRKTHLYVCGATRTGKSKFLENLVRQDIINWRNSKCGMLVLDPHGSLYDGLMQWMAKHNLDRPVIPIDLRQDDWVVAYNVLRQRPKAEASVLISNFVQAMAYVWGASGTEKTPRFERMATGVLRVLYEKRRTLVEAEHMLDRTTKHVRRLLTKDISARMVAQIWKYVNGLSPKDFDAQIESTDNRFQNFLDTPLLRRTFGVSNVSLDLGAALDKGQIILVNLATENALVSETDAALFATLLLSDLWTAAKERGKGTDDRDVKPFYVYIDEFENFVTPTIAKNLDQARGFGLNLTLANQFPRQILHANANGQQVYDSVLANARSKVVFATEAEEDLRPLAMSLFMGAMNPDEIKHVLYSTKIMEYRDEMREAVSESEFWGSGHGSQRGHAGGQGAGGTQVFLPDETTIPLTTSQSMSEFGSDSQSESDSESEGGARSKTRVPVRVGILGKEKSQIQYRSLDEQLFRAMQLIQRLPQRNAVSRLVGMPTPVSIVTPTIPKVASNLKRTKTYLKKCYKKLPFALPSAEAQRQLDANDEQLRKAIMRPHTDEATTAERIIR